MQAVVEAVLVDRRLVVAVAVRPGLTESGTVLPGRIRNDVARHPLAVERVVLAVLVKRRTVRPLQILEEFLRGWAKDRCSVRSDVRRRLSRGLLHGRQLILCMQVLLLRLVRMSLLRWLLPVLPRDRLPLNRLAIARLSVDRLPRNLWVVAGIAGRRRVAVGLTGVSIRLPVELSLPIDERLAVVRTRKRLLIAIRLARLRVGWIRLVRLRRGTTMNVVVPLNCRLAVGRNLNVAWSGVVTCSRLLNSVLLSTVPDSSAVLSKTTPLRVVASGLPERSVRILNCENGHQRKGGCNRRASQNCHSR